MFTQLVTLSDGSTYTQRTTSPSPVYRSSKDTRNHFLWQPSLESLRNVELDEAGRLRAFRNRFGRSFDLEGTTEERASADAPKEGEGAVAASAKEGGDAKVQGGEDEEESLMDLISGGVYSKSYQEAKEAMKKAALNRGMQGKKGGKKGK
jgi:hypothetical protein